MTYRFKTFEQAVEYIRENGIAYGNTIQIEAYVSERQNRQLNDLLDANAKNKADI